MEQTVDIIQPLSFEQLSQLIAAIDKQSRNVAIKAVNQASTLRNWLFGAYIVEYEQNGNDRAQYGDGLIQRLSESLHDSRIDVTLLKVSRKFYLTYPDVKDIVRKSATLSHLLPEPSTQANISDVSSSDGPQKSATLSHQFKTPPDKLVSQLSFSHIRELLKLDDDLVRFFYETECIKSTWSVRELRRQISSNLHIRIGLSADRMKAMMATNDKAEPSSFDIQIRDPYSFEFLGLKSKDVVSESELEDALIKHLQDFLLEMGNGFCFEARQKRIIIDDEYYYADLVFYNRLLHCNVIVEYALGSLDNKLFVSTYQLQLPDRKVLEKFILDECSIE